MNNQIPFFLPFNNVIPNNYHDFETLLKKIENIEKEIKNLEERIKKIEKEISNSHNDMYIL